MVETIECIKIFKMVVFQDMRNLKYKEIPAPVLCYCKSKARELPPDSCALVNFHKVVIQGKLILMCT
jgi:hypothetical protein